MLNLVRETVGNGVKQRPWRTEVYRRGEPKCTKPESSGNVLSDTKLKQEKPEPRAGTVGNRVKGLPWGTEPDRGEPKLVHFDRGEPKCPTVGNRALIP